MTVGIRTPELTAIYEELPGWRQVAMIIAGMHRVMRNEQPNWMLHLRLVRSRIPGIDDMAHAHGTAIVSRSYTAVRRRSPAAQQAHPLKPSAVANLKTGISRWRPRLSADLHELAQAFADAAVLALKLPDSMASSCMCRRARLPVQPVLSPCSTGAATHGGVSRNRARFLVEVVDAVRLRVRDVPADREAEQPDGGGRPD